MRKITLSLFSLLAVVVLLVGCWNNNGYDGGKGSLKIVINWDGFSSLQTQSSLNKVSIEDNDYDKITHTGARVVYINDDASFAQSVEKKIAEEQGVITFNIPSTKNARLYVVAVHFSGKLYDVEGNRVLWFGVVENISIPSDGIVELTMNDIDWIPATWDVAEGYENYAAGLTASKDEENFKIPIYVRDPFQIGEKPAWNQLYVKVWGHASLGSNVNGWRLFEINNKNSDLGKVHTEQYNFQPYIEPSLFNLTNASGYSFLPIVSDYNVSWE